MDVDKRLNELGIRLPEPAGAVANYVPFVEMSGLVSISGQLPLIDGELMTGRLGADLDVQAGAEAARRCAINIIAQIRAAVDGDWERLDRIVRLGGFVSSTDDFTDQPKVINGASDLMVAVFGERGRHSRSAVGVNVLPLGAAVEIEALVRIRV